jgi:hypothetical protein
MDQIFARKRIQKFFSRKSLKTHETAKKRFGTQNSKALI